jgi:hypothetical protein
MEWSPAMLDIARHRAGQLGRAVDLGRSSILLSERDGRACG